jgi:uncharacterized protein DUF4242
MVPQFVIEREIPGAGSLSETQIRDLSLRSLQTLKEMGPQIQWLHSYVTEDRFTASTWRQTRTASVSTPAGPAFRPTGSPQYAVSSTPRT